MEPNRSLSFMRLGDSELPLVGPSFPYKPTTKIITDKIASTSRANATANSSANSNYHRGKRKALSQ